MITYRLSKAYAGKEGYAKLSEFANQLPGQAAGILLAIHELGGAKSDVTEPMICEHLHEPDIYERLWPRSRPAKNIPESIATTVGQYRHGMRKLPFIKIAIVDRKRGRRTKSPETLVDPQTGEAFPNPFVRRRKEVNGKKAKVEIGDV